MLHSVQASCHVASYIVTFCVVSSMTFFFFFFQAEDGIRDVAVTGVQTCALPISRTENQAGAIRERSGRVARDLGARHRRRSEERRVGKECRSRWSPYH